MAERVQRYWIKAQLNGIGVDRATLLARVRAKWGARVDVDADSFEFGTDPALAVRWNDRGEATFEVRDRARCSEEKYTQAKQQYFTFKERWLAQRSAPRKRNRRASVTRTRLPSAR